MSIDLSSAIATFVTESKELLQEMENGLLDLESESSEEHTSEIINALFRAIHTIKGSAGIFDFEHVVTLTHIAETLLESARNGELQLDKDLISLYLETRDATEILITLAAAETEPDQDLLNKVNHLVGCFSKYIDAESSNPDEGISAAKASGNLLDNQRWIVFFVPNENVLRNGLDPYSFIHYLDSETQDLKVSTWFDAMFGPQQFDPESNYLSFILSFNTDKTEEEIKDVFEFILGEAHVAILPPHGDADVLKSSIQKYQDIDFVTNALKQADPALADIIELLSQKKETTNTELAGTSPNPPTAANTSKIHKSKTLRVEALKLDRLIDQVGEMVITGARTNLLAHETGNETLIEAMALLERLVENIRDSSLKLRMVQIGETFNKFKRVVRDIADELGKQVDLTIIGAETELDKTFVEKVSDPLMHIVRNAIDHGIEDPETRRAQGKPEQGQLTLKAYHDSGSIVIEVSDDGKGLDQERILKRAVDRGLVSANQTLQEKDINLLIFEPGFSTAESITNISGRGVGMDVVKRNIDSLRGSVEVESLPGQGSTILIRLPLTLSIIDGFMFEVHKENYVIPLDTVVECLELHEVVSEQDIQDKSYINLRTEVLPFIRLRTLFGIEEQIDHTRESLVIVQFGTLRAGLVVDSLKGEFQTVVKPLGRLFEGLKCISGATILGSGNVAIILDVSALIKSAISVYEALEKKH
ncbi:chemotaxis protein CheA [Pseudoalteromonas luteoviolacea]|uniref:Chemotaxis protein CheA n=1 Tax=Pseudoalteromonas luteoviolacea TaxID=43657 RepID=A0A0C1Q993_9GAMM|nr:chemotaxis protein CheA [Pseudoalteromonas luteoviolacea]KID57226.1 chemotaxis protein CheA [Pseudoalteromonas luteoviolacea]